MSMILSLLNAEPISVNMQSKSIIQENIADIATVYMDFETGTKAHVSVSWLNPYKEQKLVIVGEKMSLVFDDTQSWNQKLASYKHKINFDKNKSKNANKTTKHNLIDNQKLLKKINVQKATISKQMQSLENDIIENRKTRILNFFENMNLEDELLSSSSRGFQFIQSFTMTPLT